MIKYIAAAALALVFSVASASAQAKAKLFKGNYDGIANMESTDGTIFVSYSPIRFKVDAKGNIRGTAARNRDLLGNSINPPVVMQFTGKLKKIKTQRFGSISTGTAKGSGTISDGTTWTGNFTASKGGSLGSARGGIITITNGDLRGDGAASGQ